MAAPPSGANSVGLFRRRQRRPRRFGPAFRPFDHSENFPEWQPTPRKRIQSAFFDGGKGARAALRLHCAPLTIRQTFPNGNPPLGSEFSRPFLAAAKAPGRAEHAVPPFGHSENFPEWQPTPRKRIQSAFFDGGKGDRAALSLPFAPLTIRKTFPNEHSYLRSEFGRRFSATAKAPGPR